MNLVLAFVRKSVARLRAPSSKPKGWLDPEEDSLVPPRDQWIGPDDSISHYFRWIWEYLAYLTIVAELQREEAVLELGCGHGRTSRGLLSYLRSPGSYVGIDVSRDRIADAQNRITRRWPNFGFVWANVRNLQDNPGGADAAEYVFPFNDASFDVIYAASLFSHLLPGETANYLKQCARVLRPGGRVLFLEPNGWNPLFYLQIAVTPGMTWEGDGGVIRMRRGPVFRAMQEAGLTRLSLERFGFFPPFLTNRDWGRRLEAILERVAVWRPLLPFQMFRGERE